MIEGTYELFLREKVNEISPNAYNNISNIRSLPLSTSLKILTLLVQFACVGQNSAPIMLARKQLKTIPSDWLNQHLPSVTDKAITLEDEWEYRRFLELLDEAQLTNLLNLYINEGMKSSNEEVREAAEDFSNMNSN
ncbi:hypothetical protein [Brevibacillus migulae]|uniref:hypothetical protein n=1 Tax=Brevibacillus migulae TaxID=1644114 RepID=UPI00106F096B|nr:hypothetical protein [Brevibacillus migulae]